MYPPPDDAIRNYLLRHIARKTGDALGAAIMHFWILLFEEIDCIVMRWPSEQTYSAFALKWYYYLSSNDCRRRLYESVVKTAQATEHRMSPLPAARIVASRTLNALTQTIDNHVAESNKYQFQSKVKVMIYFDEAHILAERLVTRLPFNMTITPTIPSDPKQTFDDHFLSQHASTQSLDMPWLNLYDVMLWSFYDYEVIPVFVLFLSRTPLPTFVPYAKSSRVEPSARSWNNGGAFFQAPITETSFDDCPSLHIKAGEVRLSDLKEVEFLAQFGRPLYVKTFLIYIIHVANIDFRFWTMVEVMRSYPNQYIWSHLLQMARSSLVRSPDFTQRIAMLDIRLMFDYDPHSEPARQIQEELITRNMRLAYSLTTKRDFFCSGYSSEPILAEAAAQCIQIKRQSDPTFIVKTLQEIMSSGIVDFGRRGAMVGRVLLMQAYDAAVTMEQPQYQNFSAGCSVTSFIKALFAPSRVEVVLNSVPANGSGKTFAETFATARIRFTHFVKIDDNGSLSPDGMFAAFVRGFGIICHDTVRSVDVAIPVAMIIDEDTPLSPEVMSVLFVRFERLSVKGTTNVAWIDEAAVHFFPPRSAADKPVPYISLIMELGASTKNFKRAGMPANVRATVVLSLSRIVQKLIHLNYR